MQYIYIYIYIYIIAFYSVKYEDSSHIIKQRNYAEIITFVILILISKMEKLFLNIKVCQFDIIDHESNVSDHLPLHIVCKSATFEATDRPINKDNINIEVCVERFRWDRGDLYYNATRQLIQPMLNDINITDLSLFDSPDSVHEFVGNIL